MQHLPRQHRFAAWDGSQQLGLDADQVMGALADDLIEYGDLRWAMRNLVSQGMEIPQGGYLRGLRDLLKELRNRKREKLRRYDLSSVFDGFRERLDEILDMERQRIDEWSGGANGHPSHEQENPDEPGNISDEVLKSVAERSRQTLNALPEDTAGRIKALDEYEFLNPDAQKKYLELVNELRRAMTNMFFKDIENMVNNLSDGDIQRMKEMLKALNDMLVRRIAGQDPEFDKFMAEFGDMFGDDPPKTLDELLEQMRAQMAAAQSLLSSMSAAQRAELQSLMQSRFGDPELDAELRKLVKELDFLNPGGGQYRFDGSERLDLEAALDLMKEMQNIDELISEVQEVERGAGMEQIDRELLRELMGDEAVENLDNLKELIDALEKAGYVRATGDNRWELTPRGSRMIGQQALGEIYQRLKHQSLGNHAVPEEGRFGERLEQTKGYEFGDPFHPHLPRTIKNAIYRQGPGTPIALQSDDFEVYRSEFITSTATAMLVDLSWSMALRGSFQAAKKVALALHNLITTRYPKDNFHIIGFAAYAKELKPQELPYLQWDEYVLGTNMQHALLLAEKLLSRHPGGAKQIIMISDGEPTAHLQGGRAKFDYPPTPETIRATYRAVKHCTAKGIAINTFMLDASYYLKAFMDEIARINGGRVFYTTPDKLGEYILVDYVQHKRKRLARSA